MEKTRKGTEIVAKADCIGNNRRVILTRKRIKSGEIRHGVVLESTRDGRHFKVATFAGIAPAWNCFKALRA